MPVQSNELPIEGQGGVPRPALYLGAVGALPFVAASVAAWTGAVSQVVALTALITYGAIILSFLGGVRWGLAMRSGHAQTGLASELAIGVAPSLVGWGALLLPVTTGLWVLAAAFVVVLVSDMSATRRGIAPEWYSSLRMPLSIMVSGTLILGALA